MTNLAELIDEFKSLHPYLDGDYIRKLIMKDTIQEVFFAFLTEQQAPWQYVMRIPRLIVGNPAITLPRQGWKLHISATPSNAALVLKSVLPLLLRRHCHFKFMASHLVVELMNSAHWSRESGGKFITIYPENLVEAQILAEECYRATRDFEGPTILSDRRYRQDGIVYYRYGSFEFEFIVRDSSYVPAIRNPDGKLVPDERKAWFNPPTWVEDPFNPDQRPIRLTPGFLVLNNRYVVDVALKHANKGGVYRALDTITSKVVVIKEARPHTAFNVDGKDARWILKREGKLLSTLSNSGLCPRYVAEFEFGGHWFLVQEYLEGTILRSFIQQKLNDNIKGLESHLVTELFRKLIKLVAELHSRGVLIRDFNPNNIMVLKNDELRIVDFEHAMFVEERDIVRGGTHGYSSPEQLHGKPPTVYDDYYSLGATLFYVLTGRDPYLISDSSGRSNADRLREQLELMVEERLVIPLKASLILKFIEPIPEKRMVPLRALVLLEQTKDNFHFTKSSTKDRVGFDGLQNVALGIAQYLTRTMDLQRKRPWPTTSFGSSTSPFNFQHGAAGVGMFLLAARKAVVNLELDSALLSLCNWIQNAIEDSGGRPQGLYLGDAGTAWFLLEAALELGSSITYEKALSLARSIAPVQAVPDITHGSAGIGLSFLRFWEGTGENWFLDRACEVGEHLQSSAIQYLEHGLVWQIPPGTDSAMAGKVYFGYAHGNAGIIHFFTLLYKTTNELKYLEVAEKAAQTLVSAVEIANGCAYWAFGPGEPTKWVHWCNGSSGIGSALLRLYKVTQKETYIKLCRQAVNSVMGSRWRSPLVQCHGLAGNGEFLLDMFLVLREEEFLLKASKLADIIYSRRLVMGDQILFPDETGMRLSADYGIGFTGVASFLLRLSTLSPRFMMMDNLI